jgi:predicted ATPase/DNA-binding winged helix-turn-helix (wHTH) protein
MPPNNERLLRLPDRTVDLASGEVRGRQARGHLSPMELGLLKVLAARAGHAVPRAELMAQVWGYRPEVVSRTLDSTMRTLRTKLESEPGMPRFLLTRRGVGYCFMAPSAPVALPRPAPGLIGRRRELDQLLSLLEGNRALVSVVGPPGVGKTALARVLVERMRDRGAVHWVDLREFRDPRALAARPASSTPSSPHLVVLDNAEHMLREGVDWLAPWTSRSCRVLVTSREPLLVRGERRLRLAPLSVPAPGCGFGHTEAERLFLERARCVGVEAPVAADVARLVRRLDGLPLAIELAAARADMVPPGAMVASLDAGAGLARRTGSRETDHCSLSAAIGWSWDLLSPEEQRLLSELSVFHGEFGPDDVAAVARTDGDPVPVLCRLQEAGLVQGSASGALRLLETVRAFARERLARDASALTAALGRHTSWFVGLGSGEGPREPGRGDLDDLLAALRACLDGGRTSEAARCAIPTLRFLLEQREATVGLQLIDRILSGPGLSDELRAALAMVRAEAMLQGGRSQEARLGLEAVLPGVRQSGRPAELAEILRILGAAQRECADYAKARYTLAEALEASRTAGGGAGERRVLAELGRTACEWGDISGARRWYREVLPLARAAGDDGQVAWLQCRLGVVEFYAGELGAARSCLQASVQGLEGVPRRQACALTNLGVLDMVQGRLVQAEEALLRAGAHLDRVGADKDLAVVLRRRGELAGLRGDQAGAETLLEWALGIHKAQGCSLYAGIVHGSLAELHLASGQVERAGCALARGRAELEELHAPGPQGVLMGLQAVCCALEGRDGSGGLLAAAQQALDFEQQPLLLVRLALWRAEVGLIEGDRLSAGRDLGSAARDLARLGLDETTPLGHRLTELRDRLVRSGVRPVAVHWLAPA